jgi:hypothetical protein
LTHDERQVACDLYLARLAGLAGAVKAEYLPEAHRLMEMGWLSRRIEGDDIIFELTDEGMGTFELLVNSYWPN